MTYAIKKCIDCGEEFITGGFGIAIEKRCDMCSMRKHKGGWDGKVGIPPFKWRKLRKCGGD